MEEQQRLGLPAAAFAMRLMVVAHPLAVTWPDLSADRVIWEFSQREGRSPSRRLGAGVAMARASGPTSSWSVVEFMQVLL